MHTYAEGRTTLALQAQTQTRASIKPVCLHVCICVQLIYPPPGERQLRQLRRLPAPMVHPRASRKFRTAYHSSVQPWIQASHRLAQAGEQATEALLSSCPPQPPPWPFLASTPSWSSDIGRMKCNSRHIMVIIWELGPKTYSEEFRKYKKA